MFNRLQKKWKVSGLQLALILCTFALGGSLTGYAGRKLIGLLPIASNWLWITVYVVIITLLWPMAVLLVSIPFGQFKFFTGYLKKMGNRIVGSRESGVGSRSSVDSQESIVDSRTSTTIGSRLSTPDSRLPTNIAVFASGAGSNAQKIIDYFRYSSKVKVVVIACNKPGAGVLNIAEKEHMPVILIDKEKFFRGNAYVDELKEKQVDLIVLAGFLWKIPSMLIKAFPGRIINIHPALLPKYGGKGMYGEHVHAAVITNKDKESGISIHYVDELYDNGHVIFQTTCPVLENDTPDSLAQRVHKLEHEHYPKVIEQLIAKLTGKMG